MMPISKTLPVRWHLLVFASLTLLPQIALGLGLGAWHADSERSRLEDAASAFAVAARSQIDRELEAMKAALQALATSPNVERGDFPALREQALEILKIRGALIAVRDRSHQQVLNTFVPLGEPLPVSDDPELVRADDRVFETGEPTVSDLYLGKVTGEPFVLVNVPLRRGGEVAYALNMAISPDVIEGILRSLRAPSGWTLSVVDANGRVVARSDRHDEFVGQSVSPSFGDHARARPAGTVDTMVGLDGQSIFLAYDTLDVAGWRVAVAIPKAVVASPTRTLALSVAAALVFALASSAFLARLYSVRIESEIRTLHDLAGATGTGKLPDRGTGKVMELEGIAEALRAADADLVARERHKVVLMAELNHRVRNTLAVLLSVVGQTIRDAKGQDALASTASGRIMALSRAHDLLSSSEWRTIALSDLVAKTAEQERLAISYVGPRIDLRPEAVTPISQVLHELSASQKGEAGVSGPALVVEATPVEGAVRISWRAVDGDIAEPCRKGFGPRLVKLCLERHLFGKIERLDRRGLVAVMPLEFLTGPETAAKPFVTRFKSLGADT